MTFEGGKRPDGDRRSPFRLRAAAEVNRFFNAKNPEVRGKEHLKEIPHGRRVIIATTHISDLDTSLVISALGNDFDLAVASESTMLNPRQHLRAYAGVLAAGPRNFRGVDYRSTSRGNVPGLFNPENFATMADAMKNGKDILIVAHNPSREGTLTRGGYGPAYLSQIVDGAIILPVAVNVKGEEQVLVGQNAMRTFAKNISTLQRPDAEVVIGKPIVPKHIEGIEQFNTLLEKRRGPDKLTEDDVAEFHRLSQQLKAQSREIMMALAEMLPEEKRGPFREPLAGETERDAS